MNKLYAIRQPLPLHFAAALAAPSDDIMAKINALPGVLTTLTPDDVIVRAAVVCNDRPIMNGKRRIRGRALSAMAKAAAGVPVMDDHAEDKFGGPAALPWATTIYGEMQANDELGGLDLRTPFYSMRTPVGLERDAQIVGGVIKECSIGAAFRRLDCSVCEASAGECEHQPGAEYGGITARWEYSDLEKFIEWSAVYEGAAKNTRYELAAKAEGTEMIDDKQLEQLVAARVTDPWDVYMNTRQPGAWERFWG